MCNMDEKDFDRGRWGTWKLVFLPLIIYKDVAIIL